MDDEAMGRGGAADALAALRAAVDALATRLAGEPTGGDAAALVVGIEAQVGRLTAIAARLMPTVEAEVTWAAGGARSVTSWLAGATGASFGRARTLVGLGRAMRDDLPLTAAAAVAGDVPVDRLETMARLACTSDQRRAALTGSADECGEAFLLAQAQSMPAESFRLLVRRWSAAADPEADERGYREASAREFLQLSRSTDGMHLAGFLTHDHAAGLLGAIDTVLGSPMAGEERTTAQRRAQGLADVARLVLDHGLVGTGAAVRPHLSCVVDLATLRAALGDHPDDSQADAQLDAAQSGLVQPGSGQPGSAESGSAQPGSVRSGSEQLGDGHPPPVLLLHPGVSPSGVARGTPGGAAAHPAALRGLPGEAGSGGVATPGSDRVGPLVLTAGADPERFGVAELLGVGPIPRSMLARLACDSEVTRVVFGPASQVIDVGRAERLFNGPRRRAVIARDVHCRYPGCSAPPALCEIHHVTPWAKLGSTDTNDGILLCWHHHAHVHRENVTISRNRTGLWVFHDRHGQAVRAVG